MSLRAECPRCSDGISQDGEGWRCPTHDALAPLWRASVLDYETFAAYLQGTGTLQTWLPWPLPPGWQVTDFGWVGPAEQPRAAVVGCAGASDPEGVVEITIVTEEPGVGLGARVSAVDTVDPGREAGVGNPAVRLRVDGNSVPLWAMTVPHDDPLLDRAVLVGEAAGRWLWVVVRPASAVLLLPELPELVDVSTFGPELVALPFGVVPPAW
jgi:hypothetical protein